jgi:uncharacterized membrane protein
MSRKWIVILLFISLAFNMAVMSMFIYATIFHRAPFCPTPMRPPMEMEGREHHKDKSDRDRFPFTVEDKAEIKELRDTFKQKRREFMQIMQSDKFTEQKALAAMEASLKAQEDLEKKLGTSLIEMRKKMSAEEAKEFFERRMDKFRRRPRPDDDNNYNPNDNNQQRR